ncbi:hypothetical protein IFM89_013285 [Coptis chinensis]|uniref:UBX domain-containing protein n=1 Tax=Coptis chinensis TaxID=261450 RepID=A0A835IY25_9MAGN|nr:hypothetical protein IFM89_013285 [Coptis chinensis]
METLLSVEKQSLVTSFLEIAVGQTSETARQFLQATSWKLEEAIQLFYVGNDGGALPPSSNSLPQGVAVSHNQNTNGQEGIVSENMEGKDGGEVRAPLPVKRDILYDDPMLYRAARMGYSSNEPSSLVAFRNFNEEMRRPGVWETGQSAEPSIDNLASLYRPPFALMHHGSFDKAKEAASAQDKWLLVNLQSPKEFSSHMLNRDTWANEAVAQTISTNFIFWQVYEESTQGRKVCTYYKLESFPVVLVIDPITGQKMRSWSGMVQPDSLLEDLLPFMDSGPKDNHAALPHKRPRESSQISVHKVQGETTEEDEEVLKALAASMENLKDPIGQASASESEPTIEEPESLSDSKPAYPPLPEEPEVDKSLLCRVGVRLPDGRRLQRNFLRTDLIQLLWSFCRSQLGEAEVRPFRLTHAIPGAQNCLDYASNLTFEESGLASSMISVTWE